MTDIEIDTPYWAISGQEYSDDQIRDFIRQMYINFIDERGVDVYKMLSNIALEKFEKNYSKYEIINMLN